MYMVLSTNLYIYILSAVFFHVRPPRFGSVVKAAATGAAGRFSVSLYKKWYKNWLKTIFFVGKIQEKGVEVAAKDITKKCIVGKIQLKKTDSRAKYNGERRRGFGKIHYENMHCGQNTMKEKRIQGKIDWRKV